jgi:tetratricopeptide (TPR) repeat protein
LLETIDTETIAGMKKHIELYPNSDVANEFTYILANYYRKTDFSKAISFLQNLQNRPPIIEQQFIEAKISLAEHFYQQKKFEEALSFYQAISANLQLSKPNTMFHYLSSKMEVAKKDTLPLLKNVEFLSAQKEMENLVNNVHDFSQYQAALSYLSASFRSTENRQKAIDYTLRMADKKDKEYLLLSEDYLFLDNKEKAKEALLFVQEKNYEQLKQLAMLQFDTNDWSMAKYTFEQLIQRDKNDAENYRYLGHLDYLMEEYAKAIENLETFFTRKAANAPIERAAKELVISLFQMKNRPRAESIWKQHKKDLSSSANHEIELFEAIYYKDIDSRKAIRSFAALIKDGEESIKMKAYFWRGSYQFGTKKPAEAKPDFEKVLQANDKELVNEANLKLGTIYFSEENYEKSLHHYYLVIQSDEKGELALSAAQNFAFVCKTIEEWQKAIEAYEIILARWGDETLQAKTLFDIAFCYYRDKKYDSAIEMFNQAIPVLQDREMEAEAQYWIAESFSGAEQFEKAITEFLKVSYNYSHFPQWAASAELRSGEIYLQIRQLERAIAIYERIISKYGRYSDWGKQAQERLNQMKTE